MSGCSSPPSLAELRQPLQHLHQTRRAHYVHTLLFRGNGATAPARGVKVMDAARGPSSQGYYSVHRAGTEMQG